MLGLPIAVLLFAFLPQAHNQPILLQGVPLEDFTSTGVFLEPAPVGAPVSFSQQDALAKTAASYPGSVVREAILLHLRSEAGDPPLDNIVWAVSLDPSTVWSGQPPSNPNAQFGIDYRLRYVVVFIDAASGRQIYGAGSAEPVPPGTAPPKPQPAQ